MRTDSGIEAIPAARPAPPAFVHAPRPAQLPEEAEYSDQRRYGKDRDAAYEGVPSKTDGMAVEVMRFAPRLHAEIRIESRDLNTGYQIVAVRASLGLSDLRELARCLIDAAADIEEQGGAA